MEITTGTHTRRRCGTGDGTGSRSSSRRGLRWKDSVRVDYSGFVERLIWRDLRTRRIRVQRATEYQELHHRQQPTFGVYLRRQEGKEEGKACPHDPKLKKKDNIGNTHRRDHVPRRRCAVVKSSL